MFEIALKKGTNDPEIRTAVYSQIGNAYFHLKEYEIARGQSQKFKIWSNLFVFNFVAQREKAFDFD